MSQRTVFLSRFLGLYFIINALAMAIHKQSTVETVMTFVHNAPLLHLVGVIVTAAGLAMVLGHNVWTGGALPLIVTLVGWMILAKGLLFLFLSSEAAVEFFLGTMQYKDLFYVFAAISLILGGYLTYAGFRATSH